MKKSKKTSGVPLKKVISTENTGRNYSVNSHTPRQEDNEYYSTNKIPTYMSNVLSDRSGNPQEKQQLKKQMDMFRGTASQEKIPTYVESVSDKKPSPTDESDDEKYLKPLPTKLEEDSDQSDDSFYNEIVKKLKPAEKMPEKQIKVPAFEESDNESVHLSESPDHPDLDDKMREGWKMSMKNFSSQDSQVSLSKLKSAFAQAHPADEKLNSYPYLSNIGSFPLFQTIDQDGQVFVPISDVQKDLGLGPCLMLKTVKALAWLFFILTFINLPLYFIYFHGNVVVELDVDEMSLPEMFASLSIGNIGLELNNCEKSAMMTQKLKNKGAAYSEYLIHEEDNHERSTFPSKFSKFQLNQYTQIDFRCETGTLTELQTFGMPKNTYATCSEKKGEEIIMDDACDFKSRLFESTQTKNNLVSYFNNNCLNKTECIIDVSQYAKFSPECKQLEQKRATEQDQVLVAIGGCISEQVKLPFRTRNEVRIYKDELGIFVIMVDTLVILITSVFIWWIQKRQLEFIRQFKKQTIQMDDYSVKILHLKHFEKFGNCNHILKAELLEHFRQLFMKEAHDKAQKKIEFEMLLGENPESSGHENQKSSVAESNELLRDLKKMTKQQRKEWMYKLIFIQIRVKKIVKRMRDRRKAREMKEKEENAQRQNTPLKRKLTIQEKKEYKKDMTINNYMLEYLRDFEIVDINFAKKFDPKQEMLTDMYDMYRTYNELNPETYICYNNNKEQVERNNQIRQRKLDGLREKMKEYFEYINEIKQNPEKKEIPRYIYVVFKSMTAMNFVQQKYTLSVYHQFLINSAQKIPCFKSYFSKKRSDFKNSKEYPLENEIHIGEAPKLGESHTPGDGCSDRAMLQVINGGLPDEINWENIKFTTNQRIRSKTITNIIALILIAITFLLIRSFKKYEEEVKSMSSLDQCNTIELGLREQFNVQLEAKDQSETITEWGFYFKKQSYSKYRKNEKDDQDLMCFCHSQFQTNRKQFFKITFIDVDPQKNINLCQSYLWTFLTTQIIIMLSSASIATINVIVCVILEQLSIFEGDKKAGDSTIQKFIRILVVLFINIALVPVIVNFETKYEDFTPQWFFDVGATQAMTLTISIFTPHVARFAQTAAFLCLRCRDRGYKTSITSVRKLKNDVPHLQQQSQSDTGTQQPRRQGTGLQDVEYYMGQKQEQQEYSELPKDTDRQTGKEDFDNIGNENKPEARDMRKSSLHPNRSIRKLQSLHDNFVAFSFKHLDDKKNLKRDKYKVASDPNQDLTILNTHLTNQHELNMLYRGNQILSHYVYAQFLNQFICCFMFSSGLPILYFIGFCFYLLFYWAYKSLLLLFYEKTNSFSEKLATMSVYFLTVGLILHILMGAWFYSNTTSFGKSDKKENSFFFDILSSFFPALRDRFNSYHSIIFAGLFIFLIMVVICFAIIKLVMRTIEFIVNIKKPEEINDEGVEENTNFYKDLTLQQLSHLYQRIKIERQEAIEYVKNINQSKDVKMKLTAVRQKRMIKYLEWMNTRVKSARNMVEQHLENLNKWLTQKKKEIDDEKLKRFKSQNDAKVLKFENLNKQDLKKLVAYKVDEGLKEIIFYENESFITNLHLKVKKAQNKSFKMATQQKIDFLVDIMTTMSIKGLNWEEKMNDEDQSFRLQDVTQSFHILDNLQYHNADQMKKIILNRENDKFINQIVFEAMEEAKANAAEKK